MSAFGGKADICAIRQITAVCADDDLIVERIETRLFQSFKDMLQRALVGDVTLQVTSRLCKVELSIVNQYFPSALARLQTATVLLDSEGDLLELGALFLILATNQLGLRPRPV